MLVPGVGARTLFALALVAEVVHGAPSRFADPARSRSRTAGRTATRSRAARGLRPDHRGLKRRRRAAKLGDGDGWPR
jgi:hypothetical protein